MKSIVAIAIAAAIALVFVLVSAFGLQMACGGSGPGLRGAGPVPIRFERSAPDEGGSAATLHRAAFRFVQAEPRAAPPASWSATFFCSIKATDLMIAGFVLFLALISVMQGLWLRRAVEAAEESAHIVDSTMVATQRAYVVLREFKVHVTRLSAIEDIQSCAVQPIWENAGTTPIRNGRSHVNWRYFERAIPSDLDLADVDEMGNRIVSPDAYLPLVIGPRGIAYSPVIVIEGSTIRMVREMQGRLLIWGWAEYDDIFDSVRRHRTEFCYQMNVTGSLSSSHIGFSQYKRFNGVDDDCEKRPNLLPRV